MEKNQEIRREAAKKMKPLALMAVKNKYNSGVQNKKEDLFISQFQKL